MLTNKKAKDVNIIERDNTQDQLRELGNTVSRLKKLVTAIDQTPPVETPDIIPAMVNFVDNSDFIFSDEAYNTTTYTDDETVLAQWYHRGQGTSGSYTENSSSAESGEAISRSAHSGGASNGAEWLDTEGSLLLTGGYRVASRLKAKYAVAGNYMASRLQVSKRDVSFVVDASDVDTSGDAFAELSYGLAVGTRVRVTTDDTLPTPLVVDTDYYIGAGADANHFTLTDVDSNVINITSVGSGRTTVIPQIAEDIRLKISIWDNTDNRILQGSKPVLTSAKSGTHLGGTTTRKYVLEVQMPDGRTFYSNLSAFTTGQNQVINTVDATAVDSTNFVTIQWSAVVGVSRYRVYRQAGADPSYYLVSTITNGSTSAFDFGGTGGGTWTVPTLGDEAKEYQRAEGFYDDIGELLQTADEINEIAIGLQIPSTLVPNGNQFLQIEFLKDDYSATTSADIPPDSLRLDHIGLSYTNGRWVPSARDQALLATPTGTPAPPPTGGGGGGNPPSGGGENTCVHEDAMVLVWANDGDHKWYPAKSVVEGDKLVCWDGEKLAPTVVNKVITGMSRANYLIYADGEELGCSFSHRAIADLNDFEFGTRVTLNLDTVVMYKDGKPVECKVDSVELINELWIVKTFRLSKGKRNYIANKFFGHNRKPVEGNQN